ncbi:hypothetical protein Mapa_002487 [Marchantia paleacea]|nr:hypothetical protein Mapa_002487 [Marchantia paleacea]
MSGTLDIGLIVSSNKLYSTHLHKGDLFLFPEDLVHFQINFSEKKIFRAIAAFGSSDAGTISMPKTLFGFVVQDEVLLNAFYITSAELMKLKAAFMPRM